MTSSSQDKFTSWCRYLYWSDILYQRWLTQGGSKGEADTGKSEWLTFALASQWLASLWVVVEGWREGPVTDTLINKLLDLYPDYCDLLRRFRNGVYHYQPEIFDDRLYAFPTRGAETVTWAVALFYEFKRFLWEYPDNFRGTEDEREALRESLQELIGWLPSDVLHAKAHELRKLQKEAKAMLAASGDHSSPEARELLAAVDHISRVTSETDTSPLLQMLTRLNPRH